MGALGYATSKPSLTKIAESVDGRPCEMGVVAALRNGEVLGSQTVLKSDHCPGCQNSSLPERVEGAPNFREVPGFPVYGVANPTIDGIHSVIQRVGSYKGGHPVFWHNMREEPVIYINGKPFVLREVERPYKNMLEYTVISRILILFLSQLCYNGLWRNGYCLGLTLLLELRSYCVHISILAPIIIKECLNNKTINGYKP